MSLNLVLNDDGGGGDDCSEGVWSGGKINELLAEVISVESNSAWSQFERVLNLNKLFLVFFPLIARISLTRPTLAMSRFECFICAPS